MKRRDVLTTTAVLVSAGCLGDDGGDSGTETTGESSSRETGTGASGTGGSVPATETDRQNGATRTETAIETEGTTAAETTGAERTDTEGGTGTGGETAAGVTNRTFTVENEDGSTGNEATVNFANGGSRVVVTGTITGKNGCQTAALDSVRNTNSGLVVTVATERDAPPNAVCSMALVGIDYRFVMHVETPPKSVTVVHRGATGKRTVTAAKPNG